ncbi:MAG TPA: esterase [Chitinophagaceae bacterium]|nr:esterase [Chitinophagaceae bacterium]HRF27205.1 hotdog fold thioesterase [Ferruginibacter sp.]
MHPDMIWFHKNISLSDLQQTLPSTLAAHLGMEWVEIGPDFLSMRMPVNDHTRQPYGLLHGGASCALAETVGSVASQLVIDPSKNRCVGMEINANHLKAVRDGWVTATAKPLHIGGKSHVWDIRITSDSGRLVCISRLTVAVV